MTQIRKYKVLKDYVDETGVFFHASDTPKNIEYPLNKFNDGLLRNGFIEEVKAPKVNLPHKVAVLLAAYIKAQDVPIEKMSILGDSDPDKDGMYSHRFYGYLPKSCHNLVAVDMEIRLSQKIEHTKHRDYTLEEMGIKELL